MTRNTSQTPDRTPPLEWPSKLCPQNMQKRPYYRWLQSCILSFIEKKIWKPGQRIPNEWAIAKHTNLNINTVKKALLGLVQQGYLSRTPRRGTFISGYTEATSRYFLLKPPAPASFSTKQALRFSRVDVLENIAVCASDLPAEFASDIRQIKISRRMYLQGVPVLYTISWLPAVLFPGFTDISAAQIQTEPLYKIFDTHFDVVARKSIEMLSAGCADAHHAELLGVDRGAPLLISSMLNYTDGDVVFEHRKSWFNTANYSLERNIF